MKACKVCAKEFTPVRPLQAVCGFRCATRKVKADAAAKKAAEKEQLKRRREAIKTIPDLIKEAQAAFNAYIRLRDEGKPCICCGRPLHGSGGVGGAGFDCGHYRSTGSASHLRYHEDNAHGQRKDCNRYGAGRAVDYRIGLVARIGLARVEALEADNTPRKWTREELVELKATYQRKARELRAAKRQQEGRKP